MFSPGNKPPDSSASSSTADRSGQSSGEPSTIGSDLKVIGNLHSNGDIQIKGTVEGDIKSRTVTVSEGAHVQGAIAAETVHISGSIKGQVEAPTVTVARSAQIMGDVVHESLSIEAGAHIEGQVRRLDSKKAAEPASVSSIKPAQPGASQAQASSSSPSDPGKRAAGAS